MATVKWTEDQLDAITLRPRKMLVSAAAGSGKTAVLSERILHRLTDPASKADITRFLVVTFTRPAAAELRARIGKKLREASVKTEGEVSRRLARQCNRLGSAHISTIHSFCAELVRRHFSELDLPPVLKICEEAQALEIKERIMDTLIESAYSGEFAPIPDFEAFANNFVTANDKQLAERMLKLYATVSGLPGGLRRWREAADELASEKPFLTTAWGELIVGEYCRTLRYYALCYANTAEQIEYDPKCDKYLKLVKNELSMIRELYGAIENKDPVRTKTLLADLTTYFSDAQLPSVRSTLTSDERGFFRAEVRDKFKKLYPHIAADPVFSADETGNDSAELSFMRKKSAEISRALVAFLAEFDARYKAEKRNMGILDFADLEQYTHGLLYGENGELTPLSHEISASFDEIFVDEFQDINPMQSEIFNALSCECPIFQVGDIKQSIYGFRGAAPNIFSDCRRSYVALDRKDPKTKEAEHLTVFLSANFRSMYPVTAFVNRIFDPIFHTPDDYISKDARIPYDNGDQLVCRRKEAYADEECTVLRKDLPPVEMTLIEIPTKASAKKPKDGDGTETAPPAKKLNAIEAECMTLARKIRRLTENGVKGQDIAVVTRSAKHIALLEEMLLEYGITVSNDKSAPLADMPEVQLALSILACVDNPHKDIHLAGALRSPVFGFTFDDLINVRRHKKGVSLFSALQAYVNDTGFEKGDAFIKFINDMRACSAGKPASHVLWQIYTEKDFFSMVYDGGKASPVLAAARRANLVKLHSLAARSENVGRDGIYTFLRRFERLAGTKDAPTASGVKDENTVKFYTTHGSKGLEFPHCFVCGLGHSPQRTQQRDNTADAVCDDELGIAVKLRDSTSIARIDTPVRKAIEAKMKFTQFEEELRILYVALTRARDHLYVTATTENADTMMRRIKNCATLRDPSAYLMLATPIEWIYAALHTEREGSVLLPLELLRIESLTEEDVNNGIFTKITVSQEPDESPNGEKAPKSGSSGGSNNRAQADPNTRDEELYTILSERLQRVYGYSVSADLPAKLSVSRLSPKLLDENNENDPLHEHIVKIQKSAPNDTPETETEAEENSGNTPLTPPKPDITETKKDAGRNKTPLKKPLFSVGARLTGIRDRIAEEENAESTGAMLRDALKYDRTNGDLTALYEKADAAERGTAAHLFMQFCDFGRVEKNGVDSEVERLVEEQFILPYHAAIMDRSLIERFMTSDTYKELKRAKRVRREIRFNTRLPAAMFTQNAEKAAALENETLLVQGVIDCYYVTEDGRTVLLDYKTDAFPEDMGEKAIAKELRRRHRGQLFYYKLALERLLLRPVDRVEIFSFALGKTVSLRFRQ